VFHLASYQSTTGAAIVLQNLGMVADGMVAQGSTGYRLTDPFNLLAAYAHAVAITQAEIRSPTLDAVGRFNVFPFDTSLNIPSNPNIVDYRAVKPALPLYEDLNFAVSDTQAAGEQIVAHEWWGTPGWNQDYMSLVSQMGGSDTYIGRRYTLNSTTTLNKGLMSWGADVALTFEQTPRGGIYAVIGGVCVAAACSAWRINFPKQPPYNGRKMQPGDLVQQAAGNVPHKLGPLAWGVWGVFHTWELPFASLFGFAAGTVAINLNLEVVYLGGNTNPGEVFNRAMSILQGGQ
jgi:hypothetical protein